MLIPNRDDALRLVEDNFEKFDPSKRYNFPAVYIFCDFSKMFNYFDYIGSTQCFSKRISGHAKYKKDKHTIYLCKVEDHREALEYYLINSLNPVMNIVKKKYVLKYYEFKSGARQ